jgi:translation initiation factor 6 (eIF-6)
MVHLFNKKRPKSLNELQEEDKKKVTELDERLAKMGENIDNANDDLAKLDEELGKTRRTLKLVLDITDYAARVPEENWDAAIACIGECGGVIHPPTTGEGRMMAVFPLAATEQLGALRIMLEALSISPSKA